jgi:hypothetical protein
MRKSCILLISFLLVSSFVHAQDDPLYVKYSDMMRSDKKNSQVWALCAASALAKSKYSPSQFEQYAKRTVSSLKNIVGTNGDCPCSDVLGEYWNVNSSKEVNKSPGNQNNSSTPNAPHRKQQSFPINTRYWNVELGYKMTDTIGLSVAGQEIVLCNYLERMPKANLYGEPEILAFKRRFLLYFMVENVSQNDIAIYDWSFRAICPLDNMNREWNATSYIDLVIPYIPKDITLILKPGERKLFFSGINDFFWCLDSNSRNCNLLDPPKYFQAVINCSSLGPGISTSRLEKWKFVQDDPNKTCAGQPPANASLDPTLVKAINQYLGFKQRNKKGDAGMFASSILEATCRVYPWHWSKVLSMMKLPLVPLPDICPRGCQRDFDEKTDSSFIAGKRGTAGQGNATHRTPGGTTQNNVGKQVAVYEDNIPGYSLADGDAFLVNQFRGTYKGVYLAFIKQNINVNNISAMKIETHVLKHFGERGTWRKSKQKAALLGFYPQSSINEKQPDIDYTWIGKPNPYDTHNEIPSNYFTETTSFADYSNHAPYFAMRDPTLVAFKITGDKGTHTYAKWLIGTPLDADPMSSMFSYYLYTKRNEHNSSRGGDTYDSTDITQYIDDPSSVCFEGSVRPGDVHAWIGAGNKLIKATATGTSPHQLGTPYTLNGNITKIRVRENYTWILAGNSLYRVDNNGKLELFLQTQATYFAADNGYVYTNDGYKTSISTKKRELLLGDRPSTTSSTATYNTLKQQMLSMDMEVAEGDNRLFFVDISSGKLYWISTR